MEDTTTISISKKLRKKIKKLVEIAGRSGHEDFLNYLCDNFISENKLDKVMDIEAKLNNK